MVREENERRRLAREEAARVAWEASERRRLKLEWKLRRRENRRLVGLERQFAESYLASADTDKDIVSLANVDGSDSGGLKTVGLRGGLLGELFLLMRKLRAREPFAGLSAEAPYFDQLLAGFWASFVGDGFTVLVGVDGNFEKNIAAHVEGVSLDKLDAEAVAGLAPEEFRLLLEFVKIHLVNPYLDEEFPELAERRARRVERVRFVEPGPAAAPDAKSADGGDPDDNQALEKDLNAKIQELDALFEQETPATPELAELDRFLDKALRLLLSEPGLKGGKVVRHTPKTFEPTQVLGDDGETREGPPVPRVFALLLPAAPEEEPLLPSPPPLDAAPASPAGPSAVAPDSVDRSGDASPGDPDAPREPAAPEPLPYQPQERDFAQEFEPQVSNLDLLKKDLDVDYLHLPLLKALTTRFLQQLAETLRLEDPPERLAALAQSLFLEAVQELRARAARLRRDLLFLNSY